MYGPSCNCGTGLADSSRKASSFLRGMMSPWARLLDWLAVAEPISIYEEVRERLRLPVRVPVQGGGAA